MSSWPVSDADWEHTKRIVALGTVLSGTVSSIQPFGIFVELSLPPIGLIDIVAGPGSADARALPIDRTAWPKLGETIRVRCFQFHESNREIYLGWLP